MNVCLRVQDKSHEKILQRVRAAIRRYNFVRFQSISYIITNRNLVPEEEDVTPTAAMHGVTSE